MFCANCGNPLKDNEKYCTICGVQTLPPTYTVPTIPPSIYQPTIRQTPPIPVNPFSQPIIYKNTIAIVGFVLSLVGVLFIVITALSTIFSNIAGYLATYVIGESGISFPAIIAGFICSIIGLKRSKIAYARKGRRLAIAGIVLSSIAICFIILGVVALILIFIGIFKYAGVF